MPRTIALTTRREIAAQATAAVPAMLITITHSSMAAPVRLSSDPTVILSTDPLLAGTRSGGNDYLFVLLSAILPDDLSESPPSVTLAFANLDKDMVAVLRGVTTPATVALTVIDARDPDTPLATYTDMQAIRGSYNASQVTLEIGREPFTSEPCPAWRMTKDAFPAIHA